jgi:hypothetical protein
MSKQYPGGFITKNPTAPTTSAAPGIWTLDQATYYIKQGTWPTSGAIDPQFNYVTMLLHGDGTNGAQNNTFLDSSTNNFTITRNGNTTQGTFSPYGANWSNYFDGTGDYLDLSSNAAFSFGTGDFTVEMWLYHTSNSAQRIIGNYASSGNTEYDIEFAANGTVYFGSYLTYTQTSTAVSLNTWTHIAWVRASGVETFYINGVSAGTATRSLNFSSTTGPRIAGSKDLTTNLYQGYISNVRLVKGTAVYTSGFTPPTAPLTAITNTSLLTCADNRFIDESTNNFTITKNGDVSVQRFSPFSPTSAYSTSVIGGSGYFDGSGDYLRVAYNSNLYPTSSGTDYTVECWVYPTAGTGGLQFILGTNNTTVADWTFTQDAGQWGFTLSGVGGNAGTVIANQWTHLAMTRNGSTVNGYVNGARVLTTTASTQSNNGLPVNIGMRNGSDRAFTGYITDVRIVNGTAVYTGTSYTVPTAPLTAVTNTQFLSNNTNAGILDNAMMNDLETVGNAQISTSVKKYGTGSIAFDATADRLVAASSPNIAFGTGDFTVEFWLNSNNVASANQRGVIQTSDTSGGLKTGYTTGIAIYQGGNATGGPLNGGLTANVAGTFLGSSSAVITTSTWYHIALVRSSGTSTIYVNGTSVGSASTTGNCSGQFICVGGYYDTTYLYDGYIDDLRITKGYARYTSNFTAPTAAFPDR